MSVKFFGSLSLFLASFTLAEEVDEDRTITCPILECGDTLIDSDLCYFHDGENRDIPTQEILGRSCFNTETATSKDIPLYCPFNIYSDDYAWVNEKLQDQTVMDNDENSITSSLDMRMTKAYCKEVSALRQNLLPGRFCVEHSDCLSQDCYEEACRARKEGLNCHSHKDCNNGLYCDIQQEWPFASTC